MAAPLLGLHAVSDWQCAPLAYNCQSWAACRGQSVASHQCCSSHGATQTFRHAACGSTHASNWHNSCTTSHHQWKECSCGLCEERHFQRDTSAREKSKHSDKPLNSSEGLNGARSICEPCCEQKGSVPAEAEGGMLDLCTHFQAMQEGLGLNVSTECS